MQRRDFIKLLATSSLVAPRLSQAGEDFTPYEGELFIVIQAEGGWDVSSFCDPKENATFNNWAKEKQMVTTSSGISYAPFAKNSAFFEKYHQDMLVINGIDTQTNAHNAGVRHMYSGRFDEGYPSFGALYASAKAANLPLAYISNGAYNFTASLIQYTLMQNPTSLSNLIEPNRAPFDNALFHESQQYSIIKRYKQERLLRAQANEGLSPRLKKAVDNFVSAQNSLEDLAQLKNYIPDELVDLEDAEGNYNPLPRQAQLVLAAMKSGLCATADLRASGFDTHANHDLDHALSLTLLTEGVDFLFEEAKRLGIENRLTVMISSDFSRTPSYNDGSGKDHWPTASAIFMKKGASWAGKVIGKSDGEINAQALDSNFNVDSEGTILEPKHLQSALRTLAGIENSAVSQQFSLNQVGEANYFNLAKVFN